MKKQKRLAIFIAALFSVSLAYGQTGNYFGGTGAGASNTTGFDNTFLGYYAGRYNTTGYYNTFVGNSAGISTSNGGYNTFVGFRAGYGNINGNGNFFMGSWSGYSNTTGSFNLFVGRSAGYLNTTASYNIFLGDWSGYSNTTGTENTFIGYETGRYNTTGYYNTFLGYNAGKSNSTGGYNTFIGLRAGSKNTNGDGNVFLGNWSGYSNTTGNSNTFLGSWAGYLNTTGIGNVFIGYDAGKNETGSNKLYIANSSTNPPLIYGDFSTGKLGLGTTTPSEKLEVVGTIKATSFVGDGSGLTGITSTETDPVFNASVAGNVSAQDTTNWNTAYGWGDHSVAGYLTNYTETDPQVGSNTANYLSKWNGSALVGSTVFDNGTNVGIGTATPTEKLEVSGTVKATSFTGDGSGLTGVAVTETDPVYLVAPASGILAGDITNWNTAYGWGDHSAAGYLTNYTETDPQVGSNTVNYLSKWNGSALVGSTVFDNGTNVGIGTATPTEKLEVSGTVKATNFTGDGSGLTGVAVTETDPQVGSNTVNYISKWNGTELVSSNIFDNGNIGIGTITPTERLEVVGTIKAISFTGDGSGLTGVTVTETDPQVGSNTANYLSKWNGTELVSSSVFDNGYVGIGTITPTERLEVVGTVKATAFVGDGSGLTGITATETDPQVGSNTANYISKWNGAALVSSSIFDNGNVGIGTADPQAALDVRDTTGIHIGANQDLQLSTNANGDAIIKNTIQEKDIIFKVNDAGVEKNLLHVKASDDENMVLIGEGTDSPNIQLLTYDEGTTSLALTSDSGKVCRVTLAPHGQFANLNARRRNGTIANPEAIRANDILMRIGGGGYDGFATTGNAAQVDFRATEDWDAFSIGAKLNFDVTPNGTKDRITALEVADDGGIFAYNLGSVASGSPLYINANKEIGTISSSARYKENAVPLGSTDSDWLYDIVVKEFEYKNDPDNNKYIGVIAEEVQTVRPEIVRYDLFEDVGGTYKRLVGYLNLDDVFDQLDPITNSSGVFDLEYGDNNGNIHTVSKKVYKLVESVDYSQFTMPMLKELQDLRNGGDGDWIVNSNDMYTNVSGNIGIGTTTPSYKLDVVGDIYCTGSYLGSDKRFEKNIHTIPEALDKILALNGATYEFKTEEFKSKNFNKGNQYGFIAQELKEVLPELVKQDEEGYYAVNYDGVIPVLTEAIKEQQSIIEKQQKTIEDQQKAIEEQNSKFEKKIAELKQLIGQSAVIENNTVLNNDNAKLYQNNPNPFNRQTEINYYLANDVSNAAMLIFDMNGKQIKRYDLAARGNDKVVIHGSELAPGMYMYSLIADNKLVDTKRMVLTQ